MELSQLKAFVTVAEEGHLTRAADRLFTSQPAISAKLKSLEESLGVPLFNRTAKGMTLTAAGEKLLVQAQAILDASQQMEVEAKAIKGQVGGVLSVGLNSDLAFLKLPELLADASSHYPDLQMSFINGMSFDNQVDVRQGKLDTGFFFGPCTTLDVHTIHLDDIETAILAPACWAEKISYASIDELANFPWVYTTERCPFYQLKETLFQDAKTKPTKAVFVDCEDAIRELVKAGSGIALLRKDDAEKAEAEGWGVSWKGRTPPITLSIAVAAQRLHEPVIQAWLNELAKFWPMKEYRAQQLAN
ncbi:LysR family transcriptional regulator [Litoribrevibacter albus]|uniref:LysR family transcriptional regulator n=1 Tax=Litoribrevibacter albus TaxID=1473156 RepID=A0AA37W9D0_9GAMM|nr:LysR family transcriptional regulator [Litoribrevibacter albus]GLQ32486.1 LysR family transcriptional regulator [Litoribrevibacter albus]